MWVSGLLLQPLNFTYTKKTANTTTASNIVRIQSHSSGTTGVGFGGAIYFLGERNGGDIQGMAKISALAEVNSVTDLSSALTFQTATSGTNTEKVRITYDGKVGIGITNPGHLLAVNGTANIVGALTGAAATFTGSARFDGNVIVDTATGSNPLWVTRLGSTGEAMSIKVEDRMVEFELNQDETTGDHLFKFNINSSTSGNKYYQFHNGRVGINRIPSTNYDLDVVGAVNFDGALTIGAYTLPNTDGNTGYHLQTNGSGTVTWAAGGAGTVTGTGTANYISKWTGTSSQGNSIIYDSGSKVNIGATTTNEKLHLYGPDETTFVLQASSSNTGDKCHISFGASSVVLSRTNTGALISFERQGANTAGDLYFQTREIGGGVAERMRIKDDGKVGIGTTAPSELLHVEGGNLKVAGTAAVYATTNDGAAASLSATQSGTGRAFQVMRAVASATRQMADFVQAHASGGTEPAVHIQQTTTASDALRITSDGSTAKFAVTGTGALTGTSATFSGVVTASLGLNIANNQRLSIGTAGSNTGYIRFYNNNSTAYYLDWESTGARAYRYHGTSSGSAYITTFSQAGSGGHNLTVLGAVGIGGNPSAAAILDVRDSGDANTLQLLINTGQTTAGRLTEFVFGKDNGANLSATLKYYYHTTQASRRIDLFHYGTTNGLSILNDGNVGIGITNPSAKLHVNGDTTLTGNLTFETSAGRDILFGDNLGAALEFKEGSTLYLRFNTTNGSEDIQFNKHIVGTSAAFSGNISMATGASAGKFAVMSSSVHASYDFYNNGTTYLNGTTTLDADTTVNGDVIINSGSSGATASLKFSNDNERARITSNYDSGGGGRLGFWTDTTGGSLVHRMSIDNNGNVGIGITNPGYLLDVNGTANIGGALTVQGLFTYDNSPAANGTGDLKIIPSANSNTGVGFASQIIGVNIADALSSNLPKQDSTWGGVTGSSAIALNADDNSYGQFMVLTAPQNSSANTELTPRFWITGAGAATFSGTLKATTILDAGNSSGTSNQVLTSTGSATLDWKTLSEISGVDGSGTANYLSKWTDGDTIGNSSVFDNGSVGISTAANLNSVLNVYGGTSSGPTSIITCMSANATVGGGAGIFFKTSNNHSLNRYGAQISAIRSSNDNGSPDLVFRLETSNVSGMSERMRIVSEGNVGIGTTNPGAYKLRVEGDLIATGDTYIYNNKALNVLDSGGQRSLMITNHSSGSNSPYFSADPDNQAAATMMYWYIDGAEKMSLDSGGNLSIQGTLTEASSLAIKENIETYSPSLEMISKIRPVRYNKKKSKRKEVGLVAEELAEMFPELVEMDEKGNPSGVNYSRAVAVLLHGFKELYKEVKELKEKI